MKTTKNIPQYRQNCLKAESQPESDHPISLAITKLFFFLIFLSWSKFKDQRIQMNFQLNWNASYCVSFGGSSAVVPRTCWWVHGPVPSVGEEYSAQVVWMVNSDSSLSFVCFPLGAWRKTHLRSHRQQNTMAFLLQKPAYWAMHERRIAEPAHSSNFIIEYWAKGTVIEQHHVCYQSKIHKTYGSVEAHTYG